MLTSSQGGFDTLAGNAGTDTLIGTGAEIDESFTLPATILTALNAL